MPREAEIHKYPFWDQVVKRFFTMPGAPILDASHSLVFTLSEQSDYYPISDVLSTPLPYQGLWFGVYLVFWAILYYGTANKESRPAYIIGFLVGAIFYIVDAFFYTTPSQIFMMEHPRLPYIVSIPTVENIEKGTYISNPNHYIRLAKGRGDYKIIIGNSKFPHPDKLGYIFTADTFIKKSAAGDFRTVDLAQYLEGGYSSFKDDYNTSRFNPGNQQGTNFFSDRAKNISQLAYYMGIIVITWATYITNSKWGGARQLTLNIIAVALCLGAGTSVVSESTSVQYNYGVYLKTRLLILAISVGITSILDGSLVGLLYELE